MIMLLGVAGAGKSTQGKLLADEKGYAWISTGEVLRVVITGTRRHQMLEGKLLNDQEVISVMDNVLNMIDPIDEFVLDGFPRTVIQLKWLLVQAEKGRFSRIIVLHLYADKPIVYDRLILRGRQDDNEIAINKRFEEFKDVTVPILAELKKHKIDIYDIDASQSAEKIHDEIMNLLNSLPQPVYKKSS